MDGSRWPSSPQGNTNPYLTAYKNTLFAENQNATYKKSFIHRLVYAAMIEGNEPVTISEHYEQFVSTLQKKQMEGLTGVLLVYPKCIIHLLESSSEVFRLILEDLCDIEKSSKPLLKNARILVVTHCLLSRMFPSWSYKVLNLSYSLQDAVPQTHPVEVLVPDCLAMIYQLCIYLLKDEDSSARQDAQEQALLSEEGTVMHLCQTTALHSPSSFLKAYTKPISILMDSEIVWPKHRQLCW